MLKALRWALRVQRSAFSVLRSAFRIFAVHQILLSLSFQSAILPVRIRAQMEYPYDYDRHSVSALLYAIIEQHSSSQAQSWLLQRSNVLQDTKTVQQFNLTFSAIPRFTGKEILLLPTGIINDLRETAHGFFVQDYTLDRLVRTWWLLQ